MLVKIKRLIIEKMKGSPAIPLGATHNIFIKDFYINISNIVSINDYDGVNDFLLREGSSHSNDEFSLVRYLENQSIVEIIALGTADSIYKLQHKEKTNGKQLLSD
jgi:ferritin|tara:strand:- start:2044 stop:2358 length:315 start_codon:yes stop_codon:yes gene_type:complete